MPSGQCLSAYSPIFSPQAKVLRPKSNTQGFGGAFGPSVLTVRPPSSTTPMVGNLCRTASCAVTGPVSGDRDRPGGDELLVQLPGDRRRRIVVMRIELELTAEYAARGVDLVDRHLRAVDGRNARRPVCASRSGDEPNEVRLPGGAGRSLCSG